MACVSIRVFETHTMDTVTFNERLLLEAKIIHKSKYLNNGNLA